MPDKPESIINLEQENNIYNPTNSFRIDGLVFENLDGDKRIQIPSIEDETARTNSTKFKKTYNIYVDFIYLTQESGEMYIVPNTQTELRKLYESGFKFSNEFTNFIEETQPITLRERIKFLEFKIKTSEQKIKENTELHLSIYAEIGERRGLKDIIDGYFIKIDGVEYNNNRGTNSEKIAVNTDGNEFRLDRLMSVGFYCSNNGKLCYVGADGSMYLGTNSSENIKALARAGYRNRDLIVPFSNGQTPVIQEIKQLLNDVCTGKKPDELKAERLAKVVNFSGTNKRLFGTFPKTSNDELMKVYTDFEAEYNLDSANRAERLSLVEAIRIEKDQFGRSLKIYSINGREIVFRGREELPEIESVKEGNIILVGENPVNIPEKFFNSYKKKATSNQVEGLETILVVKNLRGILETAVKLGLKDEKILNILENIKKGIYSDRAIEMVDALVALNYYSPEKGNLNGEIETDSEIIFIHALLGNDEAQKFVTRRLIEYQAFAEKKEEDRKAKFRNYYGKFRGEALQIQDLCIVHSTQYEPRKDSEDLYSIPTLFDATKGAFLRNSVHLTLNHKVHSHMAGNWEEKGYTIISPFSDTLAVNGNPEAVNFEDTWWMLNPGQRFNFSKATIIAFSTDTNGELIEFDENLESGMIKLKPEGYSAKDLRTLMSMETLSFDRTTEIFSDIIDGYVSGIEYKRAERKVTGYTDKLQKKLEMGEITNDEYDKRVKRIDTARLLKNDQDPEYNFSPIFNFNPYNFEYQREISEAIKQSIRTGEGLNMEEVAEKIVKDTSLAERVNDRVRREIDFDLEGTIVTLMEIMATEGEKRISSLLNRVATEKALERRGFKVARTTRENSGSGLGSEFRGGETALSARFGSKLGRHSDSPESDFSNRALYSVIRTFKKSWHDPDNMILPALRPMGKGTFISLEDIDPSVRRILYASGITPSYVGNNFEVDYSSVSEEIIPEIEE